MTTACRAAVSCVGPSLRHMRPLVQSLANNNQAVPKVPTGKPPRYCSEACRRRTRDSRTAPLRLELAQIFHRLLVAQPDRGVVICSHAQGEVAEEMWSSLGPPERREEARRAARRLVHFGWESQGVDEKRGVEAVQDGSVVEASFAKGEWGIRWSGT